MPPLRFCVENILGQLHSYEVFFPLAPLLPGFLNNFEGNLRKQTTIKKFGQLFCTFFVVSHCEVISH
jgi:hypothetical protein